MLSYFLSLTFTEPTGLTAEVVVSMDVMSSGKLTESLHKLPVEVGKSQKQWYITYRLGLRPIMYSLDLFFLHPDAWMIDNVAYKSHFFLVKSALFQVGV